MNDAVNADQIAFWNSDVGRNWARYQEQLDISLRPFGEAAMERAGINAGLDILDVGCGCGDTTFALGERAGPGGTAVGIDISEPMLTRARLRADQLKPRNVSFRKADPQIDDFRSETFDIVFSRFGVMFFDDPVRAFSNLRRALSSNGRLAFACWRPPADNPWVKVAVDQVREHIELPPPPGPDDPGEFSFGDRDRVHRILNEAGFTDISIESFEPEITLAGGDGLDETVDFTMTMGPASRAIEAAGGGEGVRAKIAAGIRSALEPFVTERGVVMQSASWIVSARNAQS